MATLSLEGNIAGRPVSVRAGARFVDFETLAVDVGPDLVSAFGGSGRFSGDAIVEVISRVDGNVYGTNALPLSLELRDHFEPTLVDIGTGEVVFVNENIEVEGGGFLLGGREGTTYAVVDGCFASAPGGSCEPVATVEVAVVPESQFSRTRGSFTFSPRIAGIRPGQFRGTVRLRNRPSVGASLESATSPIKADLVAPVVFSVSPTAASLGQYVQVGGGGFVGDEEGTTVLELKGTYRAAGSSRPTAIDLLLVPKFVAGSVLRYVINEDDALGAALDLRTETGTFEGTVTPIVSWRDQQIAGQAGQFTLSVAPVKQVIYLKFLPSYVDSLRAFGLRAAASRIRERVVDAVRRDFRTINVEVHTEEPRDYALYTMVEIGGPDPNGLGLFGYDNTPGKDTNNLRLYDRIGGVNAITQEDGFPGYGGVFVDSLFAFSLHPIGAVASAFDRADPVFDRLFDPFRPDQGGMPLRAADLQGGIDKLANGDMCAAAGAVDRPTQAACAIFVLGNLIANTVSHEIGHSLGLANPFAHAFHNPGDQPNRLMDDAINRPFIERAELFQSGPARFCDAEYRYLRTILPTEERTDLTRRPSCD